MMHCIRLDKVWLMLGNKVEHYNFLDVLGMLVILIQQSDCVTRWNSTFIMLQSAINYHHAFYSLSLHDSIFKCCPTSDEWRRAETMCDILKSFYNITNLIFGSSFPTSNLYFGEIWKIECLIRSYLTSEDLLIQNMAGSMK